MNIVQRGGMEDWKGFYCACRDPEVARQVAESLTWRDPNLMPSARLWKFLIEDSYPEIRIDLHAFRGGEGFQMVFDFEMTMVLEIVVSGEQVISFTRIAIEIIQFVLPAVSVQGDQLVQSVVKSLNWINFWRSNGSLQHAFQPIEQMDHKRFPPSGKHESYPSCPLGNWASTGDVYEDPDI